jgi:predicted Zn-dependent peptidase
MALEVIADMLTGSLIDPDEFENERGVILEELSMAEDDPADVVNERFYEAVLGSHPLGRPIGGSAETIREATRDAVWAHYGANYRPQDLVITAAGAVDHEQLVEISRAALVESGWDLDVSRAPVPRRSTAAATIEQGSPLVVVDRPTEQANLLVGVPGLTATDPRRSALSILNSVLGGGMSSRLFQEVREKRGLAYSVYSFAAGYSDAGVFGLYAGCSPSKAPEVVRLMKAELERIAGDGVSTDELRRAIGQLSGTSALALEDSDTRMSRLGRSEITLGEFSDLDENLRRLHLVSVADVQALAGDLASRPTTIAAVGSVAERAFSTLVR